MSLRPFSDELETTTGDGLRKVPCSCHALPSSHHLRQEKDVATLTNWLQQRLASFASSINIQPSTSPLYLAAPGPVRLRVSRVLRVCGPYPRAAGVEAPLASGGPMVGDDEKMMSKWKSPRHHHPLVTRPEDHACPYAISGSSKR